MHLSHSGLQQILKCPASYYLYKEQGISAKKESAALSIGSAFHWGCEHHTADLSEYLDGLDSYRKSYYNFEVDVAMAEGMLEAYFAKEPYLLDQILMSYEGTERLEILEQWHELDLTVLLKSFAYPIEHEFHGIIDWLLLTEKGWIILDYKTSSKTPDFDKYLDQVLRYAWMLRKTFPDVPVYKIGIINVRKTGIRIRSGESTSSFAERIRREYRINDDGLICFRAFSPEDFSENRMKVYVDNLARMCDFAHTIQENKLWFINFENAVSEYGKSEYWDFFYQTKDSYNLYKIYDPMFNDDFGEETDYRDCLPVDMMVLENNVLNHFSQFKSYVEKEIETGVETQKEVEDHMRKEFVVDDDLLSKYWREYERVLEKAE